MVMVVAVVVAVDISSFCFLGSVYFPPAMRISREEKAKGWDLYVHFH